MKRIRILLVAGSCRLLGILRRVISADNELHIVAEASNAYTARDQILTSHPDVMLLCDDLPRMKGIVFLEKLMPQYPLATVVLCGLDRERAAYDAGAVRVVMEPDLEKMADTECIQMLHREKLGEHLKKACRMDSSMQSTVSEIEKEAEADSCIGVIAMGASTGETEAIYQVVK